jgi:undecaprenyl pyrophosphate phosphatase UppP
MSATKLFKDILISVPILILYLLFVHRILEIFTENTKAEDRIKKYIIMSFVIGIVSILIGIYIFGSKKLNNRPVKFGFIFGALILVINSLYNNWENLEKDVKLFIIGGVFVLGIALSYFR